MRAKAFTYQKRTSGAKPFIGAAGRKAIMQAVYFAAGLLMSRAVVFEGYAPFGVALTAAVPFSNLLAVAGGSILGYLMPSAIGESMKYLAAIIAAAAIRWTLNDIGKVRHHPLYAPCVAMGPVLATGLAVGTVDGFTLPVIVMCLTESLLAGGAAFFFSRTVKTVESSKGLTALTQQELACVVLTACILTMSLSGVTIGYISVGRVLAVLAILFCARYGGVAGGAVAGVSTGIVFSLASGAGLSYISGAYAFGGLMAGIFSPVGRIGSAAAFILSNAIMALITGDTATVVGGLYEVMAATLIFMVLPKKAGNKLTLLFADRKAAVGETPAANPVLMRLDFAAKALSDVSGSVDEVSKKLATLYVPDLNAVYQRAAGKVCRGCGLKSYCWENEYAGTMGAFRDVTPALREKKKVAKEDFPRHFADRCSKINEVSDAVSRYFGEFAVCEDAEKRVRQVREAVSDQFMGMSEMLADMTREMQGYEKFDTVRADRIKALLQSRGAMPIDVSCRIDRYGRLSLEIELGVGEDIISGNAALLRQMEQEIDRKLDTPCVSIAPGCCRVQVCERPQLQVKVGSAQHVAYNGRLCGDNYDCFNDGMGRLVVILSDGMGSGGRAAVDGAMATGILSKLSRAGLSFDCALRIVNSALYVKSGDESLATLDVARLDLFSGDAEFLKAGASMTLIKKKRQNRVIKVETPSLPAGILNEVEFLREHLVLEKGDVVLMLSDGVTMEGETWLRELLLNFKGADMKALSEAVVSEAVNRRVGGHDDDTTAIALQIA